jgi:hypothetical protein
MDHWTKPGFREIPLAAALHWKIDGRNRAEIDTDTTAFAKDSVNLKLFADGTKAAEIDAGAAAGAKVSINYCLAATHEISPLPNLGLHQQVKIGCINICVAQDTVFRQGSKSCGQAGFAGAAFAADNYYFAHETASHLPLIIASIFRKRSQNRSRHSGNSSTIFLP